MINIDYSFNGEVVYNSYNQIVSKIKEFKNWEHLGMDESGNYGLYGVIVGDTSKPVIFINGAVHGNEYHVIEPIIHVLKLIEDGNHPDQTLNNEILENYCIIAIPMCNPWGMMQNSDDENGIYGDRYTSIGGDINRGFYKMELKEQRIMRDFFNRFKPFSSTDFHMYNPPWGGVSPDKSVAVGNTNSVTNDYIVEWVRTLENVTNIPTEVYRTQGTPSPTSGSVRGFFASRRNPYTPHTLGYMLEHERRGLLGGEVVETINSSDLWNVISMNVTLSLIYSIKYFENFSGDFLPEYDGSDLVTEIVTDHKKLKVKRNYEGYATEIIEEFEDMTIVSKILRDSRGRVIRIVRELV